MTDMIRDGTVEIWKDIIGHEGLYKISNIGNIYSYYSDRLLNPRIGNHGYKQVMLCKNKQKKMMSIHRLVAMHFIENDDIENKTFVNHKDEIKTNNFDFNLEWCTKKYNNTYNNKTQRSCKEIEQLELSGKLIKVWSGAREASKELGLQYKNISSVARNKRKTCGGFIWRFV